MRPTSTALVFLGSTAVVLACNMPLYRRPLPEIVYGATTPPAAAGTTSRTIDSTGFVDNGGRTSDLTNRTELSGMRATETGSNRPTGTAGVGLSLPIEATGEPRGQGAPRGREGLLSPTGATADAVVGRIGRAECDLEVACGRIGADERLKTDAQCMAHSRERAREAVEDVGCARGFDEQQLSTCLTAIRHLSCEAPAGRLPAAGQCDHRAICSP